MLVAKHPYIVFIWGGERNGQGAGAEVGGCCFGSGEGEVQGMMLGKEQSGGRFSGAFLKQNSLSCAGKDRL